MSTFVVGDIQGCFDSLLALTEALEFDRERDELWAVGDLVNRGPRNADVLRFFRDLGDRATIVLGNHDLHLIARAAGVSGAKSLDTLDDVLGAPDCDELIEWLRRRPIAAVRGRDIMVHAGVLPSWTADDIVSNARAISDALSGVEWKKAIAAIVGDRTHGLGALSAIMQRVRMIDADEARIDYAGSREGAPSGAHAWFEPTHQRGDVRIIFGHWSALGLLVRSDAICLDSGCVWGGSLSAYNLEAGTVTAVASVEV